MRKLFTVGCGMSLFGHSTAGQVQLYWAPLQPSPSPGASMKVLKKYANRKIYDSSESCYVTMSDIRHMVKERQSIKVVDSTTGDDITRSILLLILSDQENSSGTVMLTNTVLESLIRMYDDPMGAMLASFLDRGIKDFMDQGETFKKQFDSYVTGSQQDNIARLFEQYTSYWTKGSRFTPPDDKS